MSKTAAQWLKLGRISGVHGVKGWVKVHSYTQPVEKIVLYQPWRIELSGQVFELEAVDSKFSGKILLVALAGITDRDQALSLVRHDIWVSAQQLPALGIGEYYWYQLEGLAVVSLYQGGHYKFGRVEKILETGANDVLVVKGDQRNSLDGKERLIPYLIDHTILNVDLDAGEIQVDWDPEF
jgi:16S rRNA processing protein RimM